LPSEKGLDYATGRDRNAPKTLLAALLIFFRDVPAGAAFRFAKIQGPARITMRAQAHLEQDGTYTTDNKSGDRVGVHRSIASNTFVNRGGTLAGRGTVIGNVTNHLGGTVSPGDAPGTLTVNGNYTQASNGTLLIDIEGANNGQFSVLDVLGNANLDGFLHPVLLNGFTPTIGESFTFLDYASLTGAFSSIQNQVFEQWNGTLGSNLSDD
jgi:hypothetical protein